MEDLEKYINVEGGNSDMKLKIYIIIGIVAIVSLIFFIVVTSCGKGHQWSNNCRTRI